MQRGIARLTATVEAFDKMKIAGVGAPHGDRSVAAPWGLSHERLTYEFHGRRFRLTDVHGQEVKAMLT